jgi:hypothetical protein
VNLTQAAHDLWNISQKETISPADVEAAAGIVDKALQVGELDAPIPYMLVFLLHGLILLKHESYQ